MAPTKASTPSIRSKSRSKSKKKEVKHVEISDEDREPGVVYIGHIPHGFYERQLNDYFSQFGNVRDIKLSRSKKTGNSKGYAFVKFQYGAVAKTVAETCHNYLFFNKLLKCEYRPMSDVHPDTFHRYRMTPNKKPKRLHNQPKDDEKVKDLFEGMVGKQKKKMQKLKALGVDIDFDDIVEVRQPAQKAAAEKEDTAASECDEPMPEDAQTEVKVESPSAASKKESKSKSPLPASPKSEPNNKTPLPASPKTGRKTKSPLQAGTKTEKSPLQAGTKTEKSPLPNTQKNGATITSPSPSKATKTLTPKQTDKATKVLTPKQTGKRKAGAIDDDSPVKAESTPAAKRAKNTPKAAATSPKISPMQKRVTRSAGKAKK